MTYVFGKYSPVAFKPEKYGVSYYKNPEWDLRTCVREYVYLYIEHFGNNDLPQLKMQPDQQIEHHHTSVGLV
jgi:hypothetical protein